MAVPWSVWGKNQAPSWKSENDAGDAPPGRLRRCSTRECQCGRLRCHSTNPRDPVVPSQKVMCSTLLCSFGGSNRTVTEEVRYENGSLNKTKTSLPPIKNRYRCTQWTMSASWYGVRVSSTHGLRLSSFSLVTKHPLVCSAL